MARQRGKVLKTTGFGAAVRAFSVVDQDVAGKGPIKYRLKGGYNGGFNPSANHPASLSYGGRTPTCDCTGLVCWALGFDRYQPGKFPYYGGYINTDSALQDSRRKQSFFAPRKGMPRIGDVVIYGGKRVDGKRVKVGHWGLVVAVHRDFKPGKRTRKNFSLIRVVDCSSSMSKRTGAAIHVRGAEVWSRRGVFLRYVRAD